MPKPLKRTIDKQDEHASWFYDFEYAEKTKMKMLDDWRLVVELLKGKIERLTADKNNKGLKDGAR